MQAFLTTHVRLAKSAAAKRLKERKESAKERQNEERSRPRQALAVIGWCECEAAGGHASAPSRGNRRGHGWALCGLLVPTN
eukprot:9129281-Pyramimonas_sp.AAC.1